MGNNMDDRGNNAPTVNLPTDKAKLTAAVDDAKRAIDFALNEFFSKVEILDKQKNCAEGKCKELESDLEAVEDDLKKAKDAVPASKLLTQWAQPLARLFNLAYGNDEQISQKALLDIVKDMRSVAQNVQISLIYHEPGSKYDQKKDGDKVTINYGTGDFVESAAVGFEIGKQCLTERVVLSSKQSLPAANDYPNQQSIKGQSGNGDDMRNHNMTRQGQQSQGQSGVCGQQGMQGQGGSARQPSQGQQGQIAGSFGQQGYNEPQLSRYKDFDIKQNNGWYVVFKEAATPNLKNLLRKTGMNDKNAKEVMAHLIRQEPYLDTLYPCEISAGGWSKRTLTYRLVLNLGYLVMQYYINEDTKIKVVILGSY